MTARGVEFLDVWIDASIMGEPGERASAGNLAAKLLADAAVAGFTLADLGPDQETAETYIRNAIVHPADPGTPGD
jgi:hypothetical protein